MPEWKLKVRAYTLPDGRSPFDQWLDEIDESVAGRIMAHVKRMKEGNFGISRQVGGGVMELKVNFGPGYRVYYLRHESTVVILLCAGDKRSQDNDIQRARRFAADYKGRA